MKRHLLGLLALIALVSAPSAHAFTLTAMGGVGFGSGEAQSATKTLIVPTLGGEVTFGVGGLFEIGGFFDTRHLRAEVGGSTGDTRFFGGVARIGLGPVSDFFVDGKIGLTSTGVSYASGRTDEAVGYGVGLGTVIGIAPLISLKPRVGYNILPAKNSAANGGQTFNRNVIDVGVLLSFSLL